MDVKRGDIVYVEIPYATGHEMMKDRPAVVVSNNAQNYAGEVVSVIYLTGSQKADRPYHVEVKGAMSVRHGPSTALCENIYTVDKSRLGKIMGRCSEDEMDAIDNGILLTLDLGDRERRIENTRQTPPHGAGRGRGIRHKRRGRIVGGAGDLQATLRRAA